MTRDLFLYLATREVSFHLATRNASRDLTRVESNYPLSLHINENKSTTVLYGMNEKKGGLLAQKYFNAGQIHVQGVRVYFAWLFHSCSRFHGLCEHYIV